MMPSLVCRRSLAAPVLARAFAAAQELWATQLRVKHKGKALEVEFNTGERFSLPAEYLRVESPAAGNLDARDACGRPKVVHGRRHVSIMDVEPIGSYAVRLTFDDLHSQGIFTWPLLHELGSHKLPRMRRYLRLLKDRGLSRDPPVLPHRRQRTTAGGGGGSGGGGGTQQQQGTSDGSAPGAGGASSSRGGSGAVGSSSSSSGASSSGGKSQAVGSSSSGGTRPG
ncbi:hypothetical protein ABPG75_000279 [Micractinium tetrahymenae]